MAFHRLARRRPGYRWWKPLVTGMLAVALLVAVTPVVVIIPIVFGGMDVPEAFGSVFSPATSTSLIDIDKPWHLAVAMVPIILMLPVLLFASSTVQGKGVGLLSSVTGRLRIDWLGRCLLLAFGVIAVYGVAIIGQLSLSGKSVQLNVDHPRLWLLVLTVLLLVPFQAAAEEYVFRGYLMQLVGSWLRHPAFAILLPLPLFVFSHDYNVWGMWEVGVFALVTGWLTWRTGGLEAAISLHVANNVLLFLLESVGFEDIAASSSPVALLTIAAVMGGYALLADLWARATGVARYAPPAGAVSS